MLLHIAITLGIGIALGTIIRHTDDIYDHGLACLDKASEVIEEGTKETVDTLDSLDEESENNVTAVKALCSVVKWCLITVPKTLYFTILGLSEGIVWFVLSIPKILIFEPFGNLIWR